MKNRLIYVAFVLLIVSGCSTFQQAASQRSKVEIFTPLPDTSKNQSVILLHGLNRNSRSMYKLAKALSDAGYDVCSIDYPSRYFDVKTLASNYILPKIEACINDNVMSVNFVTHSLGGIIVRQLDEELKAFPSGKLVMLSPPNQGSEAVDKLSNIRAFQQMAGPAGNELGTSNESLAQKLPSPSMPFGVIAARHSNSPMSFLIPGDDDGKVSIERMQLPEMSDFVVVNSTHSFMMRNTQTIEHILFFLKNTSFKTD